MSKFITCFSLCKKLQTSEQTTAQLEEEKEQLEFMNSIKKYDTDYAGQDQSSIGEKHS